MTNLDAPEVATSTTTTVAGATHSRLPRAYAAVVVIMVVAGVALRAWALTGTLSPTESDEAVLGLMAIHFTRADVDLMYWGQHYGGPVESVIAAALFLVTGPSVLVSKLVGVLCCAVSACLTWRIGRRTVGPVAGAVGGALFWCWSPYFVQYSTKISIYFGSLALALAVMLLVLQLRDGHRVGWWWSAGAGVCAGLAWWASPQTLFLLLPVGVVFLGDAVRQWRAIVRALPFVVTGALPWLVYNASNDWVSLQVPPRDFEAGYLERVAGFFPQLPMLLALRHAVSGEWVMRSLGIAVSVAVVVFVLVACARRPRGWGSLAWVAALFPFAYAISPLSVYTGNAQPRYLLTLMPVLALLVARALVPSRRAWLKVAGLTALCTLVGLTFTGLRYLDERHIGWFPGSPDGVPVPPRFDELTAALRDNDVDYAYADYWIAFRATFETAEDTIVAPIQSHLDRYPPYSASVAAAERPAFITLSASRVPAALERRLAELGVSYRQVDAGPFTLFLPATTVSRADAWPAFA